MVSTVSPTTIGRRYHRMDINNGVVQIQEVEPSSKRIHFLEDFLFGYDETEISIVLGIKAYEQKKRLGNDSQSQVSEMGVAQESLSCSY